MSELFQGESARVEGPDADVRRLDHDSRRVVPGSLFAALVGAQSDGHDHVSAALARGATAILCERPVDTARTTRVLVENSRRALARAARTWFGDPASRLKMIGVTGTNGKTTTVHLLESVLRVAGEQPGVLGTLGARYGVHRAETSLTTPESTELLALLHQMAEAGTTAVAMEVSSHALAQERVAGVDFDVGVFLNLSQDHLDYHPTMAHYRATKARLVLERIKSGGAVVLNLDDPAVQPLAGQVSGANLVGFSAAPTRPADGRVWARDVVLERTRLRANIEIATEPTLAIRSSLVGRFNLENILAAVAVAHALGIDRRAIQQGVESVAGVPGRLELIRSENGPVVLVDFAHTPDGLYQALATVRELVSGRLFCVFGCGGDRDSDKRPKMGEAAARLADWVVVTTDNPRGEDPAAISAAIEGGLRTVGAQLSETPMVGGYHVELDRETAIRLAIGHATPDDAVLIAGKGHEGHQIWGLEKRPFDDRAHARAALGAAGFGTDPENRNPNTEG